MEVVMKVLIALVFSILVMDTEASLKTKMGVLSGIKLNSGEILSQLNPKESSKVLESLKINQNIEIRDRVIYPEEVSRLFEAKLTKDRLIEKNPNPQDYN
jgi:hypothetical protein